MAARYVISVGGTGQHLALALTRLVRLGALQNDIELVAIDPDSKTELTETLLSPGGMSGAAHPLKAKPVIAPFDVEKIGEQTFARLFLDADHPKEQALFEALFSKEAEEIPVAKGMYGTPCVGATVFAEGAKSSILQDVFSQLANAKEVYVCGSVVGGTGAGVMHKLVGEIRRYYKKREMFGIFMLPWFKVRGGGGKGSINDALIDRNAKHGLQYFYDHTIPEDLDASILIGYPDGAKTAVLEPLSVGEGQRGENAHYLHLAAAFGFLSLAQAKTNQKDIRAYGIVHDERNESWLLDEKWENNDEVLGPHNVKLTLRNIVRGQRVVLALLRFLTSAPERKKVLEFYDSRVGRLFSSADAWGDLHISILDAERNKAQQGKFAQDLFVEFDKIREEVSFCVTWIDKLFPQQLSEYTSDPLLDKLRTKADEWPLLAQIWKGLPAKAELNEKTTASAVARHHAKLILAHGLNISDCRLGTGK